MGDEVKIVPTVGRMVYYKSYGTPNGEYPSVDRAATITDVREVLVDEHGYIHEFPSKDNVVGELNHQCRLCVFNPEGLFFTKWLNNGEAGGQWDWMPYQKGQAKKTEELEKKCDEDSGTCQA